MQVLDQDLFVTSGSSTALKVMPMFTVSTMCLYESHVM